MTAGRRPPATDDRPQRTSQTLSAVVRRPSSLFDTHCHLDFHKFAADVEAVVARAVEAGVTRILVPGLDLRNAPTVLALAERFPGVYAAVGIHPNSAADWDDGWIDELRALARHEKVVAIGEIGLDYYWDNTLPATQHRALARQLALAVELGLPVIIHNREASADVIRLLGEAGGTGSLRGVLHSFSADLATAEAALGLGFYLGFTGPLTYPKADDLRAIAARVPFDRILIETDAPYLAPQAHRGQRNEPAYVRLVAERLAGVRGLPFDAVAAVTTANAEALFGLPTDDRRQTTDDSVRSTNQ